MIENTPMGQSYLESTIILSRGRNTTRKVGGAGGTRHNVLIIHVYYSIINYQKVGGLEPPCPPPPPPPPQYLCHCSHCHDSPSWLTHEDREASFHAVLCRQLFFFAVLLTIDFFETGGVVGPHAVPIPYPYTTPPWCGIGVWYRDCMRVWYTALMGLFCLFLFFSGNGS